MKQLTHIIAFLLALLVMLPADAEAVRIKDIAYVQGVRENQLLGYGLVVGLDGTGDVGRSALTVQSTASMLSRMGIKVDKKKLQTKNVAAVMVTAQLPPFAQSGQKLDVTVSSMGNARSLKGGTLLMSPLRGPDGKIYAMAQGSVSVGGYSASGVGGNSVTKNHVTAGRIPDGALVERSVALDLSQKTEIRLILHQADFTTAVGIARTVSELFAEDEPAQDANAQPDPNAQQDPNAQPAEESDKPEPFQGIASATDASTVRVKVPDNFSDHVPQFIAILERIDVQRSTVAKVIINERTGTVVLGGDVTLGPVAIAHGNLNVAISTDYRASQPNALGAGQTTVTPDSDVSANEQDRALRVVAPEATIGDVVAGLNALGATPRDLVAILQAIKSAGALNAKLVIQ
ncbi:flagellar basal body P-ring protein FlgI [Persicimonas caeni]|nr:flagellar basal body P-ring protein FlgI [Persicimonas caeni]